VDVDKVLLRSRAELKIDPWLLIEQPTDNDVAKVIGHSLYALYQNARRNLVVNAWQNCT